METIDYPTRKDLVSALVDFHKKGVHVEVVHNGLTLAFPNGIDATAEDEEPEVDNTEKIGEADGVEKTPVEGDTLLGVTGNEEEPMDRSSFTVEGTCSECGEAALAEPDGTWIHTEASIHGDDEGEFVPNEPTAEEDQVEDLIGTTETSQKSPNKKRNR